MASNFVPMLSSSPPPLDDCPDDDDDEFGNFASANIPFDSLFESPVAHDKHKSFKSGENGVNDVSLNNDFNAYHSFSNPVKQPLQNHVNELSCKNQIISAHITKQNKNNKKEFPVPDSPTKTAIDSEFVENFDVIANSDCYSACDSPSKGINDSDEQLDELEVDSSPIDKNTTLIEKNTKIDSPVNESSPSSSPVINSLKISEQTSCTESTISQSKDLNPHGLFNNCDFSDCDVKSEEAQISDNSFDFVKEKIDSSEDLAFEVNFETADDFDDFQQAVSSETQNFQTSHIEQCNQNLKLSKKDETDFNNLPENESCDQDEFDDFQSFTKTDNLSSATGDIGDPKDLSCDEDFQNFQISEPVWNESEDFDDFQGCSVPIKSDPQDFANFDAGSFDEKVHSESPEFADFESASFSSVSDEAPPNFACASSMHTQDKNSDKISTVLNAIFPPVSDEGEDYCDQSTEILKQNYKGHRLWEKLHETEQAPSLRFQWGISHSFQQLLRSVNVDYHSILRTSSVPIFASSLSLLEPVKGQTNSANAESDDRDQSPKIIDPIPPVEFDWTGSGLVNPLDSGQAASVLMDLSFLAATDTATSSSKNDYSFENELLKPFPVPASSSNSNKTLILEEILSKNVCSLPNSKTAHRPSNISEEANSVLDQLPDLSFMRAKVLMFPISSKT